MDSPWPPISIAELSLRPPPPMNTQAWAKRVGSPSNVRACTHQSNLGCLCSVFVYVRCCSRPQLSSAPNLRATGDYHTRYSVGGGLPPHSRPFPPKVDDGPQRPRPSAPFPIPVRAGPSPTYASSRFVDSVAPSIPPAPSPVLEEEGDDLAAAEAELFASIDSLRARVGELQEEIHLVASTQAAQ